jgi:predicted Zn-dependent protease
MDYAKRKIEILLITAITLSIFIFGPELGPIYDRFISQSFFNPCNNPIKYSIGSIDGSFGVSSDYLLSAIKEAEDSWEKAFGKNLFDYTPDKGLKVNLIYDYRQDSTIQLNELNSNFKISDAQYLRLKKQYEEYISEYNSENTKLNSLVLIYNQRYYLYQKEVNSRRNSSSEKELVLEKNNLDGMLSEIRAIEDNINLLVVKINSTIRELNTVSKKLDLNINHYNEINQTLEQEFEQGNYTVSGQKKEINIYQFENRQKLVIVLTHELGHSLGLDHIGTPDDIMYGLNTGESQKITNEDLSELNNICSRNGWGVFVDKLLKR